MLQTIIPKVNIKAQNHNTIKITKMVLMARSWWLEACVVFNVRSIPQGSQFCRKLQLCQDRYCYWAERARERGKSAASKSNFSKLSRNVDNPVQEGDKNANYSIHVALCVSVAITERARERLSCSNVLTPKFLALLGHRVIIFNSISINLICF